jgi:mono/diheme cytochrome c family protein
MSARPFDFMIQAMKGRQLIAVCLAGGALVVGWAAAFDQQEHRGDLVPSDSLLAGKRVYDLHCAACHGDTGDGLGPASIWLFPKPRDFSAGLFKIQSTPAGTLPSDEDLFQTITEGMPGSSMPSFTYLSEEERWDVVSYVKHLTSWVDESGNRISHFDQTDKNGAAPIVVPDEPPLTIQSLTRGREIYVALGCAACHGETGAGDGFSAPTLRDHWGIHLPPRDFNTGSFRGGAKGRDLYLRIAAGMAGTPMPPYDDEAISSEDRWALVHFIQSLRQHDMAVADILAPPDGVLPVRRVQRLPHHPGDDVWPRTDLTRIPLNPLWGIEPHTLAVGIRAVHDGRQIAILMQWKDDHFNGTPVEVEGFQDSAAVQFSLNGSTPFIGMGDANNPVNIWHWKAGWQQEVDGHRPDVETLYASMHVDLYPESSPLFRTAEAAGNIFAESRRRSPVEDGNARGFGTFEPQPVQSQNVGGYGIWRDGHWQVVFLRALRSRDLGDVQFTPGELVPVSFAIWDGEQRDRNGKKIVSNWYQLALEP